MRITAFAVIVLAAATLSAQSSPTLPAETLLDRAVLKALDEELSGVAAKDHVARLTQLHRVPASPGFHDAIAYVMDRAKAAGLSDVHVETFPGDGTTWYPEIASRIRAAVHLDMVGADPFITKSVLHVTRSPWSIATVTDDVEEVFGRYVIDGAMRAAGEGDMTHAIRSRGGSKDAFWADITPYESGSDHWIYQEGGFAIPSIYLRDHPDIYIHTTGDRTDNIEPTKIKRSAFIAAASGYYLATMPDRGASLARPSYAGAHERLAEDGRRAAAMAADPARTADAANIVAQGVLREQRRLPSIARFTIGGSERTRPTTESSTPVRLPAFAPGASARPRRSSAETDRSGGGKPDTTGELEAALADTGNAILTTFMPRAGVEQLARGGFRLPSADARVPVRNAEVKGPLAPGGDWLREKAGAGSVSVAIARVPNSDDVTYEIANFIDGTRTVSEIRDAVSAEFEPLELEAVAEYLDLLARAGASSFKR